MKRTASTLMLLAGFGGGCAGPQSQVQPPQPQPQAAAQPAGFNKVTRGREVPGVQGPGGEPVMAARGAAPMGGSGVRPAGGTMAGGGMVRPVSGEGCTNCAVPGVGGNAIHEGASYGGGMGYGAAGPYGPQGRGVVPVPTMGPPGAVAAVGALGAGYAGRQGMPNGRTSINFTGPAGMKVTWQLPDGTFNDEATGLTAPKEYNFTQGSVFRLRLTSILPDHPGKSFYPTLEIAPGNPKSLVFLSHSSVPLTFTADDFAQARAGNLVVKVIYLPDPVNQTFNTVLGAEEVVSTRLAPGEDPVAEAQRMGTILAVVRMGNIDLENRVSPVMTAPPGGGVMVPPGAMPTGPGVALPPGGGGGTFVPGTPPAGGGGSAVPVLPPTTGGGGSAVPPGLMPPKGKTETPPVNPPGTSSVRPPAALPSLPAASDLPPAPVAPLAPVGPGPKPPTK